MTRTHRKFLLFFLQFLIMIQLGVMEIIHPNPLERIAWFTVTYLFWQWLFDVLFPDRGWRP